MKPCRLYFAILAFVVSFGLITSVQAAEEVNVYSSRQEVLIAPLFERFTEETGIKVNVLSASAGALLARLRSEGRNSPADILLTVDAGNLHRAREAGILQVVDSDVLQKKVPPALRDKDGYWYGLSMRARVIFRSRDRVPADAISSYEELADPKWKGKICVRSSDNIYNQSLVASMIAAHGVEKTEEWARGLVANMARRPQGGDRDQLAAVAAGQCDLALANTYYYGGMLRDPNTREAAEQVAIVWPNQDDRGVHVNVSGAGITAHARNVENAIKLLEFMVSPEAQAWYAEGNSEYPVVPGVEIHEVLQSWGEFRRDDLNLSTLGINNAEAVRLMDRAGWR